MLFNLALCTFICQIKENIRQIEKIHSPNEKTQSANWKKSIRQKKIHSPEKNLFAKLRKYIFFYFPNWKKIYLEKNLSSDESDDLMEKWK